MRYPYRNFLFYLILLKQSGKDISAFMGKDIALPFDAADYADLKRELILAEPKAKKFIENKKLKLKYEDWMDPYGFHIFVCDEFADIADQVEDLINNLNIRHAVEYLIYMRDTPEKILRKVSSRAAVPYSVDCIIAYQLLFFNPAVMTLEDWRRFVDYLVDRKYPYPSPYKMCQDMPAHRAEATVGVDMELDTQDLLRESVRQLYFKFQNALDNVTNPELALKYHKEMLNSMKLLAKNEDNDLNELSKAIKANFKRVKRDEYIADQTRPLFDTYDPLEPVKEDGS